MFIINCLYTLTNIWVEIRFIKKYGSVEFYLKAKLGQHVSPFPTLPLVNQEVILSFETLAMFQERSHQLRNRSIGLSLINGYLRKMLLGSICYTLQLVSTPYGHGVLRRAVCYKPFKVP